jgi:hypothetical protein
MPIPPWRERNLLASPPPGQKADAFASLGMTDPLVAAKSCVVQFCRKENMLTGLLTLLLTLATPQGNAESGRMPMPNPRADPKSNASINPRFNPSINPKVNASLNPRFNPWINPDRNTKISPKYNPQLDPKTTASLNPASNPLLDPKHTGKFSGLRRLTPDGELLGYIVKTDNKAVLLLFDRNLQWASFAVDNGQQGYNVFGPEGSWKGYLLKNAAGGLNEFDLEGDWLGFITDK